MIQPMLITEVMQSYENDNLAQEAIIECTIRPHDVSYFQYISGLIKYKENVYVGETGGLRQKIVPQIHQSNLGGHAGIHGTYQRVKLTFQWPGIQKQIKEMVESCPICQINKPEHVKSPGLLQPLPILDQAWAYITMDFIEQLPKSRGKKMIWVVVDRLTKYSHFIALAHPISASTLAQVFIEEIYRLHGLPTYIVSDRGTIFTSQFWREMMQQLGVQQQLSTSYDPQTDGQTERVNQCLETYLRCMSNQFPKNWSS